MTARLTKLSCLGAKDTTQSLWETLVSLLKSAVAIKSVVDAWDVLQSSVARQYLCMDFTKLSKWLVAQCNCVGSIICYQKCVANGCVACE